ncbi:1-acyl-sn-glycerol-3-phosphate acyltransferase [Streptomyces ipomoeae]|jgi:1-acyl-sn-glycerol-3-phosphate acyltransferase|uniref:Acyltransferase n=2 Tax=Streptomyces ipomoeae TaxID=103232 RepID=L1KT64_9ACTN|nr:lysophospholipid acyltransferase family protein [Streptomyces ipomoeae]EKX63660.1 acyltransferase [Streptomyces ipomoeae 91-03]MDX2692578.1 lysophospholipid acyltransferase family protein [Streptomyces ipomoeae]MDX2819560.1 lysophospholipid acyltransferase family protein [Streptomyces ipomoeae]MDX2840798.1 lysophospholipid acyltransferase family protein [Streptomyces ipomoeae]MDX2873311.1 lysophospholipid acyltransferase family protein [Streptomyces ipomoeae]
MLSRLADVLVPAVGRLTVTAEADAELAPGSVIAANHTSLADPAVVLAALHRLGVRPVVMAAAGLWRIPVLGGALTREGHIPVYRWDRRAARALDLAATALEEGRLVLIYAEGGLPLRKDAAEAAPHAFRSGLARLAERTGAPVVPVGQAGARRVTSGSVAKQLAGLATAPLRRPDLHVHIGAPLTLTGDRAARTTQAHGAVTAAWRTAATHLGEPAALAA